MTYNVIVTIEPADAVNHDKVVEITLDCHYFKDANGYGNKHWLSIVSRPPREIDWCLDLRYNTDFHPDDKMGFLASILQSYWSGKDGAWSITSLSITKAPAKGR